MIGLIFRAFQLFVAVIAVTAVLVTLFSATLQAQDGMEDLNGLVLDAGSGEGIPGATVQVEELGRGVSVSADGGFTIEKLPEGRWTLIVRSIGYTARSVSVSHPSEEELTIRLESDMLRGEDVVVTASPLGRNINYQPVQALDTEQLQQRSAPSLGEILDGQPGVATRSFGSAPARPVIRGFDGDRVLVMQNGERMGDLSSTAVDHAVALDPLSMDRVEIVRGPASLLYGASAIGGVVNMFSNDMPREWERGGHGIVASHVASMNRMGAGLVRGQYGSDNVAATGRLIYRGAGDLHTPEGRLPDTSLNNLSYGAGVGVRSEGLESGLSISGMDYTYGLPEAINDPGESIEIRMNRVNLQSITTLNMNGFLDYGELRIHYSDYHHDEFDMEIAPDGEVDEELEIAFSQKTLSSSLLLRHRAVGNLEGAIGVSFNRSVMQVGGVEALTPNASGHFLAGYIYEELGLHRNLTLKGGARLEFRETDIHSNALFPDAEDLDGRRDLIVSGAAGLNYTPGSRWTVGLQLARAYRTPTIEERYSDAPHAAAGSYDLGDPTLENEYSLGYDLFVDYRGEFHSSQLSLFLNRIDGYVDFSPTGQIHEPSGLPVFRYMSKNALLYGFEWMTELTFSDSWSGSIGFDYVRGREREGESENLTFIPPFRSHLSLRYSDQSFWAGPRVRIVASQQKVAPNEEPTDGYLLIGAEAGYRFGHGFTLSVRLDNLLNEHYRDHLSRVENRDAPMPGRNVNAILRWEF